MQSHSPKTTEPSDQDPVPAELRKQVTSNYIVPLWESGTTAFARAEEAAHHWPWQVMQPIMQETAKITVPSILERRVMMMVNPTIPRNDSECCSGLLSAGIQALMPGEVARPHRHSMHALRFVLEGEGAETIVEGKHCSMQPGDLVVTPGWTWHEHHNPNGKPTIWVDILDVAIHRALGTDAFQPGPPQGLVDAMPDATFANAGFLPIQAVPARGASGTYSPIFRYAAEDARRGVAAAPLSPTGSRIVRYANPVDGGSVLPTIDCYLHQIDAGGRTQDVKSPASQICVVVDGEGESKIGDAVVRWAPKDVFTVPRGRMVSHVCRMGPARIFVATDQVIYDRLDMLPRVSAALV